MKLANDVLTCIILTFQKAIVEEVDISDLLRALELEPDGQGKLRLKDTSQDVWKEP